MTKHYKGFTLIEVALALALIGILVSGGVLLFGQQHQQDKKNQTYQQLADLRQLMLVFVQTNGYLPCPDTNGNGQENRKTNGACTNRQGFLPAQTLGVKAKDAWGVPLYYRVNARAEDLARVTDICQSASVFGAVRPDGSSVSADLSSLEQCPNNNLYYCNQCAAACTTVCTTVTPATSPLPNTGKPPYFHTSTMPVAAYNDGYKNMTIKTPSGNKLETLVVATVVSFGKNGGQTWGTPLSNTPDCPPSLTNEEQENCDNDRDFIDKGKELDDTVMGITLREVKKAAIDLGYDKY